MGRKRLRRRRRKRSKIKIRTTRTTTRKNNKKKTQNNHSSSYRGFVFLFADFICSQTQDTREKPIETDPLYESRHRNAMLAFVMDVQSQDGHCRRQGDNNDRDTVIQAYSKCQYTVRFKYSASLPGTCTGFRGID